MTGTSILSRFLAFGSRFPPIFSSPAQRWPNLHTAWLHPTRLPASVSDTPALMRTIDLLGPLDWSCFPDRDLQRHWRQPAVSHAAFAAAMLVKLNEGLVSMGHLRQFLVEHPAFIPLLGFSIIHSRKYACGFDPDASLPTQRHLTRMLREIPNATLQFLLSETIHLIQQALLVYNVTIGECISLDTKHILAWVKENNPKAYVETRFDKSRQPAGDPDCKLVSIGGVFLPPIVG